METVLNQNTDDPEEMYKIAVTLCEMGEHRKVNQLLKTAQYKPYDINVLHYMAVSCFNLKKFKLLSNTGIRWKNQSQQYHQQLL